MQIFEITNKQNVSEISFGSIAKKVGSGLGSIAKYAVQAPVRAFNKQAGVEYAPLGQEKDIGKKFRNAQVIFHQAVYLLTHNFDETAVMARLTGEYGASTDEAMQAIDSALSYIEKERAINPEFAPQMTRTIPQRPEAELASTGTFANMTNQLTKPQPQVRPASIAQRRATRTAIARGQQPTTGTAPGTTQSLAQLQALEKRFNDMMARARQSGTTTAAITQPTPINDVLAALKKLGYNNTQANAAVRNLPPGLSASQAVRQVLQQQRQIAESLTWSQEFDPSCTLLEKIKKS